MSRLLISSMALLFVVGAVLLGSYRSASAVAQWSLSGPDAALFQIDGSRNFVS